MKVILQDNRSINVNNNLNYKYHQLAMTLQNAIQDGLYEPGERLPSIRKIAQFYQVSITTVRQAFEVLGSQDLIAPQARSGFFVVKSPEDVDLTGYNSDMVEALIQECCVPKTNTIDSSLVFAVLPEAFSPIELISKALQDTAKEKHELLYKYANYENTVEVRTTLARHAMKSGVTVDPREIVFADGFLNALEASLILLNPKRKPVALESPTNYAFIQALQTIGMPIVSLELTTQQNGEVEFDFNALEKKVLTNQISCLILSTSVRNPSGDRIGLEQRKKIANLLERSDLILFEDDTLRDTVPRSLPPIYSLTKSKRVLWFSSFAEILSPTLKFCWIAAGSFNQLLREKWRATTCAISGIQLAVIEKLLQTSGYERKLQEIQEQCNRSLNQARDFMLKQFPAGTKISEPIGGYSLWIQLPKSVSGLELYHKSIILGFSFIPGIAFSPNRSHEDYIRITPGDFGPKQKHLLSQLAKLITISLHQPNLDPKNHETK